MVPAKEVEAEKIAEDGDYELYIWASDIKIPDKEPMILPEHVRKLFGLDMAYIAVDCYIFIFKEKSKVVVNSIEIGVSLDKEKRIRDCSKEILDNLIILKSSGNLPKDCRHLVV